MRTDKYTYKVARHFLPALINADDSGLAAADIRQLNGFEVEAMQIASKAGWRHWHWSTHDDSDCDFGECEVTRMQADRATVELVVSL